MIMMNPTIKSCVDYLRKLSGQDKEPFNIDHNYVKNWNAHPDSQRTKPARMLFMNVSQRRKGTFYYDDDEIDVTSDDVTPEPSPFETQRSKNVLTELERALKYHPKIDCDRPEKENILENASPRQRRIYNSVMEVLNADILAKTAYSGKPHEAIKRRIATEKFSKQLKLVFATNFWDFDVIMWIHKLIIDDLSFCYLLSYLSLLQALKMKIPSLVDRMLKKYSGPLGYEYLSQLLKKDCDPAIPVLNQHKPKRLSCNPFLLMSCAGFDSENAEESMRFRFWSSHLNALCKTIYIPASDDGMRFSTADEMVKYSVLSMKQKISQLKNHFPNRPVILAGWTIGALIACHVALEMPVDAVICFGFPLWGVNGSRGDLDDPLLNSTKPILFIVGQNANMCSTDDIEDFRSRIQAETGCVIVGGADDLLRMSPKKMLEENVTQPMVDRCILDEISDFLLTALMKVPAPTPAAPQTSKSCPTIWEENSEVSEHEPSRKRRRRKPKEWSPDYVPEPARKRGRQSAVTKEVPSKPPSPSSSETSSSEEVKKERKISRRSGRRKGTKRRVGRPPVASSRRRGPKPSIKPIIKPIEPPAVVTSKPPTIVTAKPPISLKVKLQNIQLPPKPVKPPSPTPELPVPEAKPAVPFAQKILPKTNDPVDVAKAFGFDSFFLPCPITPEQEDGKSAEETETANEDVSSSNAGSELVAKDDDTTPKELEEANASSTSKLSETTLKAVLSSPDKKPITVSLKSPAFRTVFPSGSVLSSGSPLQLKNLTGVSLIGSPSSQGSSTSATKAVIATGSQKGSFGFPSSSVGASKTIITIPSSSASQSKAMITVSSASASGTTKAVPVDINKAMITIPGGVDSASKTMITVPGSSTRILVTGTTVKTQAGKVLKLLTKTPVSMKKAAPAALEPSSEQQVCNLSLLSDVAGMTEPMTDTKKVETGTSSSATLVKLAAPEKNPQQLKRFQVIRSLQARSPGNRMETAEEMVEKQLAIQALNKTLGAEGTSTAPAKESGYSICFTKPDGTILSRTIARGSGAAAYVRHSLLPQSGRGRSKNVMSKQQYHPFYRK